MIKTLREWLFRIKNYEEVLGLQMAESRMKIRTFIVAEAIPVLLPIIGKYIPLGIASLFK